MFGGDAKFQLTWCRPRCPGKAFEEARGPHTSIGKAAHTHMQRREYAYLASQHVVPTIKSKILAKAVVLPGRTNSKDKAERWRVGTMLCRRGRMCSTSRCPRDAADNAGCRASRQGTFNRSLHGVGLCVCMLLLTNVCFLCATPRKAGCGM